MTSKDNHGTFLILSSIFKSRWHALLLTSYPGHICLTKYSTQESNIPGTISNLLSYVSTTKYLSKAGWRETSLRNHDLTDMQSIFLSYSASRVSQNQQRSSFDLIWSNHHLWILNLPLPVSYRLAPTDRASVEFHQSISWSVYQTCLWNSSLCPSWGENLSPLGGIPAWD